MANKLNKLTIHFDKLNIFAGMIVSWGALGLYRGFNEFEFDCQARYNNDIKQTFLYSAELLKYTKKLGNGLLWSIIYINPLLLIYTIPKEIYRLEVDIRGLEDEKKRDFYKRL
jgi:hypothetical protein